MCSFLVTNILDFILEYVNFFLKFRGPDLTNDIIFKQFRFIHNLLNITGEISPQPFISDDKNIVAIFNGEIYNHKEFGNYKSDGYCLLDAYYKYGDNFIKFLDGEFAVTLFDFEKNIIIMSTDIFSTKPLWYSIENKNIGICTYKSGLERLRFKNIKKIEANTTYIISLSDYSIIEKKIIYKFDLKQHKNTFNDWIKSFNLSILKRTQHLQYDAFVCLSSGYDSGCICSALNNNNISYYTYTILAEENVDIINKRIRINKKSHCKQENIYQLSKKEYNYSKKYLKKNCEEFVYTFKTKKNKKELLTDDKGAVGMSYIFDQVKKRKHRIYLSGQGVDEIYSDYGYNGKKFYSHSNFGGYFPKELETIFPWTSFYRGTQESYLSKEEHVSGCFGIEGRYPFLDKNVVQEFLWLTPELKNKYYKSPLHNYMNKYQYPFDENKKIGFRAASNLK